MKTEKALKMLDIFFGATTKLYNDHLKEWKENGGKIIGYSCSYIPEEIISSADCIPFRLRGRRDIRLESIDHYMGQVSCAYVKHLFETILRDDLNFLDGMLYVNTCDHMRRVYDNVKQYRKFEYTHLIGVPKCSYETQITFFREELKVLRNELEAKYSIDITDEKLWKAIKLHNETRSLQNKLYNLRKQENPPITGAETLAVMVAGTAMPKDKYNMYLGELIEELCGESGDSNHKARLMVVGPAIDDPDFISIIEDMGGLVVTDSICFGTRIFWNKVDESGNDPLSALAHYYLSERPGCTHSVGHSKRIDYVKKLSRDFSVDGIVGARLKFCDNWAFGHHVLDNAMKEVGMPFLVLEKEYQLGGVGQMRTRIQAFLEVIEGVKS
jgi:benzoyl-CoA reductase/2-hydroxyglutaryl-CoA dehydratase subunit BcrC/BadD/HgdB